MICFKKNLDLTINFNDAMRNLFIKIFKALSNSSDLPGKKSSNPSVNNKSLFQEVFEKLTQLFFAILLIILPTAAQSDVLPCPLDLKCSIEKIGKNDYSYLINYPENFMSAEIFHVIGNDIDDKLNIFSKNIRIQDDFIGEISIFHFDKNAWDDLNLYIQSDNVDVMLKNIVTRSFTVEEVLLTHNDKDDIFEIKSFLFDGVKADFLLRAEIDMAELENTELIIKSNLFTMYTMCAKRLTFSPLITKDTAGQYTISLFFLVEADHEDKFIPWYFEYTDFGFIDKVKDSESFDFIFNVVILGHLNFINEKDEVKESLLGYLNNPGTIILEDGQITINGKVLDFTFNDSFQDSVLFNFLKNVFQYGKAQGS